MGILDWFRSSKVDRPRAAVQQSGGGVLINTSQELEEALRAGMQSVAGVAVNPGNAMRVAAVYRCVTLRAGIPANMPLNVMRRVDERTRERVSDHPVSLLFKRRPNRWQTPSQFKRMMTAHVLLRGNAYALIVRSRSKVIEIVPLDPDRVECKQNDDLTLAYVYTRKDGRKVTLKQSDVMHMVGLTLDGVHGVSVIRFARETIGSAILMEDFGSKTFKNGARPSSVLTHPGQLGIEGRENLKATLDEYRSGGDAEGKALILEEGMTVANMSMTSEDAQWIESRKLSMTDIGMFFGIPPHMLGNTEKSTSWGTGIEQQTQGFVSFTAEDDLTTWEETVNRDLFADNEVDLYVRFNRASLVRGDIKTRYEAYQIGRQIKVLSANDVRESEDMNPIEGGDLYENPAIDVTNKAGTNDPSQTSQN